MSGRKRFGIAVAFCVSVAACGNDDAAFIDALHDAAAGGHGGNARDASTGGTSPEAGGGATTGGAPSGKGGATSSGGATAEGGMTSIGGGAGGAGPTDAGTTDAGTTDAGSRGPVVVRGGFGVVATSITAGSLSLERASFTTATGCSGQICASGGFFR